jgi:hypothetical protein
VHVVLGAFPEAAPAVPASLLAALGLIAFLGYLVATGTLKVYAASFGALILGLADLLDFGITVLKRHVRPFGVIADGLRKLDAGIRYSLAELALGSEHVASWFFTQAGNIMEWTGREIADLAETTANALHLDRTVFTPRLIRRSTAQAEARLDTKWGTATGRQAQDEIQLEILRRGIDRLDWRTTHAIPKRIDGVEARQGSLTHDLARVGGRVKAVERKLGAKAFAGAVAVALTTLGLGWARCRNVGKVGKAICRTDSNLLDTLLADAALLTVAFNLRTFTRELQDVTDETAGLIHRLVR